MRVLIADDHEIFLESLSLLIATFSEVEVVGNCKSAKEVLNFLPDNEIDLLIADYNMPLMSGIELTTILRQQYPNIKVLLMSVSEEAEMIREAFLAGVWGYMMKRAGKAALKKAIETIGNGQRYFSEYVLIELMRLGLTDKPLKEEISQEVKQLSEREIEIIILLAKELSSQQISETLLIAPKTVETHRYNILRKLGVKNTIGIIKYALKNGLIK